MFINQPTVRVRAVLLAALAACSACGGGGGGGNGTGVVVGGGGTSPPPPPPPGTLPPTSPPVSPPSTPPTVAASATTSASSVHEGQPFTLDASTSSASSGAALTYAWTQTSGPAVTIASPTSAVLNLSAAEVTASATARFQVTATAGAASSSATVDVTFTNIAQTPVFLIPEIADSAPFNAAFSGAIGAIAGNWNFGLVGTHATPNGPISFAQFEDVGPNTIVPTPAPFGQTFTQPAIFELDPALPIGTSHSFSSPFFAATEESANRYRLFRKTPGGAYTPYLDRSIDRPCATYYPVGAANPSGAGGQTVLIGQRERGFSILSLNTTGSLYQEINTGQSFCALAVPQAPIDDSSGDFGDFPTLEDVIAIDTVTNTVSRFGPTAGDPTHYSLKAQVPVRLNSTTPLHFVAATTIRARDQYGFMMPVAGLALVYTDGNHAGQHRLVTVGMDAGRTIRQTTRSWPIGVPSDVILDDLDDDGLPELIVISSTSPQAIVYEMRDLSSTYPPMMIPDELMAAPSFLEVGLGATAAIPRISNVLSLDGLYVAYRDKGRVNLFWPPE